MKRLAAVFSTFFGIGFFPKAPGTASSAVAVLLYILVLHKLPWPAYALFLGLLFLAGSAASGRTAADLGEADPRRIVIDEALGQFTALFLVRPAWLALTISFLLFRFFDIFKPYPIRKLEAFRAGWGIMADDVGAGVAAGALTHLLLLLFRGLSTG